ncbi:hypothetical protein NLG97_g45 [Lecanicillium saksenae]|uniref:Uncharacterized protein n=1 Tax=Lecanicillium saksenae TaxID=468837 RepID=A0ACC1R7N6_9HYPO|nr:hypothetical protein NLG97_g45 [Lecanicillium saksenae]
MDVRPIEESLEKVITKAIPGTQIQSLRAIASPGLHQVYWATLRDGGVILCSLPQSRNRRVLRCEYGSIRSEATILQWLSSLCGGRPKLGSSKSPAFDFEDKKELRNRLRAQALSNYLPNLLEHGTIGSMQRLQYNVISTRPGEVLASLRPPLTAAQRASVDFQIGQMLRAISLIRSPTFQFGNAETILPPVPERSSWEQRRRASVQMASESFTRWSDAFGELLNGAIQDAQSNQITASYDSIRRFHRRFAHALDAVVEPRLVLIDAGMERNVLVSLQESESGTCDTSDGDSDFSNKSGTSDKSDPPICQVPRAKVAGLREWTKPIFGDPLLSVVLCQTPSKNIVQGFSSPLVDTLDDMDEIAEGLSQKRQYSQIRLNLYRVYHALNAISIEYIRRDDGSDPRELRARKALVDAIRELEVLEEAETSKRRRRRLEVAPSKRPRTSSP